MRKTSWKAARWPVAILLSIGVTSCARNPVTGRRQLAFVSESQEIRMGQQFAQEIIRSMGVYDDKQVHEYVSRLGLSMAAKSERPNLPWAFYVMDDPTVNAFALPGGPIFVTRGILTHMNDEAELAGLLGHEIAHITARHSVQQMTRQQLAQIGLGAGSILSSDIARFAGVASQGLGILFLRYGRDAESQADQLGFKYMVREGYDPAAMADLFQTLERVSKLHGAGNIPQWLSTHPNPGNRVKATHQRMDTLSVPREQLRRGREEYLAIVDGMTFGVDPRQGYIERNTFYHPRLRFKLDLPSGWPTQHTAEALLAISPERDAILQLAAPRTETPAEAERQFFRQQGVRRTQTSRAPVNGFPAVSSGFEAQSDQGTVEGTVTFLRYDGLTYQLLGYTSAGRLRRREQVFRRTIASFSELTDSARLNVQPFTIELVKVDRDMTIKEFNRQYPSTVPVERVAVMNGVATPDGRISVGTTVKRVVGGR